MKRFSSFITEASKAAEMAKQQGLTAKGPGYWFNQAGKLVAKTEGDRLVRVRPESPEAQEVQQEYGGTQQRPKTPQEPQQEPKEGGEVTIVFGRFNPPTVGHEKLLDAAAQAAGKGTLWVFPSRSVDSKKNPLEPSQKVPVMKKMFPKHAEAIKDDSDVKTIFDALKMADADGFKDVQIVVGSDRVSEFDSLAQKYNGELYNFDNITTISAGDRDADAEGVEGMSASKMRKAAADDDFETFSQGIPSALGDSAKKQLFNTLRKQMKVTTEGFNLWEIAPKFDWKNLRENYVSGNIFKMDSLVENLNTGLVGKVLRRGTNYLICVTEDNIMFKSWIRDIKEYTEVNMARRERVKGKPNTLFGTTGYLKNAEAGVPGQTPKKESFGMSFINKYRKK